MSATFPMHSDSALGVIARCQQPRRRLAVAATAGLLALSVILATGAPARADSRSDTVARALIAAVAIGAVIHSIDKSKKRRAEEAARHAPPPPPPAPAPVHARPETRLPQSCAIEIAGRHRSATVYPARCLRREGVEAHLPRRCGFDARIFGRVDRVYAEDCLLDAGFRLGRGNWRERDRDYGHGHGRGPWDRGDDRGLPGGHQGRGPWYQERN